MSSFFVYGLTMMNERCPESFRTNCHWSRSVMAAVRKRLITLPISVNCARWGAWRVRFVINFWWFFVVLEHSLSTVLVFITFIIPGYRAGRANRSNRPTKGSLHWTGFKFGICPQKHRAQLLQEEKKKEIWPSPMTKPPIPTENSKTKGQHTNATKNFD